MAKPSKRQVNEKPANFKVNAPGASGIRGNVSETLGPRSATKFLGKGKSLDRGHVGPAGAPYHDKPR